ncbi:sensor domain-containing diguanylate cyclase [Micromonospora sp. CPCC 206061]|uniref:sensor domain-containing diguanylate cyclase n=1 Tax=Micromonospora sp. CPCC 206061 TaxID=3122410 RepID=UPI002FEFCD91
MPPELLLSEVTARLTTATTVQEACAVAVSAISRHTPAMIATLLHVHDRLRCVAAAGSWQVYSSIRPEDGVAGRAFTSGKTQVVSAVETDPDYISLGPDVAAEVCTPILDLSGRSVGALNIEWTYPVDLDLWRGLAEQVAELLGERIAQLGGPPAESRGERLLRHAMALTAAGSDRELLSTVVEAARDVSGLSTPVLAVPTRVGARLYGVDGPLGERLRVRLSARTVARARQHGTSYTIGDPARLDAHGFEELVEAGVRSMIAVPVGPVDIGAVLLIVDEGMVTPAPETVNLVELLATQAWTCLDRLTTLEHLRERATSDPLTGLRHQGSFGERIARATPDRTALLAIDVDQFKNINDTYGHQAGDQVLVEMARALQSALRQGDELYRIGGDEFVAVVDVARPDEATGIGERLAAAARTIGRTISVGVALRRSGEAPELTLRRADAALYDVKREGRDGVRLAGG